MAEAEYTTHDAGRVRALRDAAAWLEPLGLLDLEAVFALPAEQRGRAKALARLTAPDGSAVFVKRYDYSPAGEWLRGALKLNPPIYSGPREHDNLRALAAAGLRVPLPLASGERDERGRRRSFVALAQLAGEPLDALPRPPTPAARRAQVHALADLVARLHGAGFWHRDLYLCNVFSDERLGLGLLDCERVDHRDGGPPLRWRVKDLAALDYSAPDATGSERLRFLRRYLGLARLDPAAHRLARAVRRKARRLARHGRKGP